MKIARLGAHQYRSVIHQLQFILSRPFAKKKIKSGDGHGTQVVVQLNFSKLYNYHGL